MLLDVTLRDGAYVFQHQMTTDLVLAIASCLDEAGVPYMELGHGISVGASARGIPAAASDMAYAQAARSVVRKARLGMIALPSLATFDDLASLRPFLDFIRIGTNANAVDDAAPLVQHAKALGYEVFFQMIRSTRVASKHAAESARKIQDMGADVVYIVDSAGCLSPWEVAPFVREVRSATTLPLGYHAHNHLGVALANSLTALEEGCEWIDASLRGIGRGAGNVPLELLLIHLARRPAPPVIDMTTIETALGILDPLLPPEKRGIGREDYLAASLRLDLCPWSLYQQIAETVGVEIGELVRALATLPGVVEILPHHLIQALRHLGVEAATISQHFPDLIPPAGKDSGS